MSDFKIKSGSSWVSPSDIRTKNEYKYRQSTKFIASDPENNDNFGYSVDLSSYGTTAIVGAYLENTSPNTDNGAAYIFTRSTTFPNNNWTQQQKLVASDPATSDYFGISVALSGVDDYGNTAIVGAYLENTSPNTANGAAYVFTRSGTTWTQQQKLVASDPASSDSFGRSVALSSDGNTAIVGASQENTSPNNDNGAAYIFTRSGTTWTQQQKLLASDADNNEYFGISVALSADGNTAIVGSQETTSPNSANGAAYVFTRSASVWTQQQKLLASDPNTSDYFGFSVALSSDGNTALIGAYYENTSPNTANGAAYVFTRSASVWTQQQKLVASDAANGDQFGFSVDLSSDGNIALIGAPVNTYDGAAYIFTRSGSTWTQQQKMLPSDSDAAYPGDAFGTSVALSSDAAGFYGARTTALIGAYQEDTSPNTDNGAAYIFEPDDWARVNAVSVNNGGTWSVGYSIPPGAPTLTVSNVGSMYTLAWNRPLSTLDITGYSLESSSSPSSGYTVLGDPGLDRSWTIYRPEFGILIVKYYRVAAETQYGTGSYSNILVF